MADNGDDTSDHAALRAHVLNFVKTGVRKSGDEMASAFGDLVGGVIEAANPEAGVAYSIGRAMLSSKDG